MNKIRWRLIKNKNKPGCPPKMHHPICDPFLDILVTSVNCFMIEQFQIRINILIIVDSLINLINRDLNATRHVQTIEKSIKLNSI